jgi:hypothetical protein
MAEGWKDHVAAITPFKTQLYFSCLIFWLNWRPGGALRWKGEDRRLGRSGSGVWKAGTYKVVAPACVG